MKLLLDTCALSEYMKKKPNLTVIDWLDEQNASELFVSDISIAEIKKGAFKKQQQSQRYERLMAWVADLEQQFSGRILPISPEILHTWARLNADNELRGKSLPVIDSMLAATALTHELVIVTRNVQDFQFVSVSIVNPWQF